jgi:ABC-type transport system involved in multi-copper enzyme maturation permease subunit
MVGPILHHEMMLGSRRSRQYFFRWIYAGWLVLQVAFACLLGAFGSGTPDTARYFIRWFVVQQIFLVILATPAFVAGAITDEKARGTLQYLLTTDVTSWQVIVGKLLGRSFHVVVLALAGLPLFCFLGALGGLGPLQLLLLAAGVLLPPLLAVGAGSLLTSVWCRRTSDAVIGLYVIGALVLVAVLRLPGPLHYFDPFYPVEPLLEVDNLWELVLWLLGYPLARGSATAAGGWQEIGGRFLEALAVATGIAVVCLGLAVWRLRPAYIRQLQGEGRKKDQWWRARRALVSDNPIRWKEQHVEGLAPISLLRRVPTWVAVLFIFSVTTALAVAILAMFLPANVTAAHVLRLVAELKFDELAALFVPLAGSPGPPYSFMGLGVLAMLIAGLVVGIRCSGAVSGEREKQTWEALLLTPLTSRQLIRGKLWGIMGSSYLYLVAYGVPALALSLLGGPGSVFWVIIWLGVALLAMYFIGAAGIWCSVRCKSSWRSLLWTMGIGYGGGALVFLVTSPVMLILAFIILLGLFVVDSYFGTGFGSTAASGFASFFTAFLVAACVVLAGAFWGMAWFFLNDAQKWVADRERTRHWRDEPLRFRPRRRVPATPRYYR